MSDTLDLDQVKTAARRVLEEIFPADDEAALIAAVTEDFVNHDAPPGTPPGPAGLITSMHALARAFTEQQWTVHQVIAEGDTAVVFCTHSGRHTGPFFGLPASGRRFAYRQMHLIRLVGGKGAEHWAVRDDASLMRQLTGAGSLPL
ncbi:ester cyclase [Microbacteriaceae bacterium VKM Ac-2854]|nr:ester cyclase [Microbacteriaceae bacterium VKM Ac-2854]